MMICSNETWWWNGGVFRWIGWRAEWDEKLRNWEEGYGLLVRCMLCAVWMRPAEKEERMHIDYLASLAPAKPHGAFQGYLYPSAGSFFCLFFRLIKYQSIWSILLSFLWLFFLSRNVLADRMCVDKDAGEEDRARWISFLVRDLRFCNPDLWGLQCLGWWSKCGIPVIDYLAVILGFLLWNFWK